MPDLGPLRKTLTVVWRRHLVLAGLGAAVILVWTWLLAQGRVSLLLYLVAVALVTAMVAAQVGPALARRVEIRERGLVVQHVGGVINVFWAELTALYVAAWPRLIPLPGETRLARTLRLATATRTASIPDDLEDFEELLTRVANEVNANVAASCLAAWEAGQTVEFGPLRVHRDEGVTLGETTWAWTELPALPCRGGAVVLDDDAEADRLPLGLIPNPQILLRILEQRAVAVDGWREALGGAAI